MTVIIFLIVLAVLIFVHELGHFISARAFGIRVDAFKIGFGPKLISWKRGETEYGVNLIPFGGFVRIFGENPDAVSISGPDSSRSFINKARWKQAIVLASGVLFNFIFAWFLYSVVLMSGITASTAGFEAYANEFKDPRIMVAYVMPGSPAEMAGLKDGDIIREVGNVSAPLRSIEVIQSFINSSGNNPVSVRYEREKIMHAIDVVPTSGIVKDKYAVGILMSNVVDLKLPFFTAIYEGLRYTLNFIKETAVALYTFIANIFTGHPDFSDISGPVGIAGIVGDEAHRGFSYLLMITAVISINLGVVNLIPFPALDGGRLLFVFIESIFRRRIPIKFANVVNIIGFTFLMILMVAVTWKDVANILKFWR